MTAKRMPATPITAATIPPTMTPGLEVLELVLPSDAALVAEAAAAVVRAAVVRERVTVT